MLAEQGYPVCAACELLGLPRSSYYYQQVEVDERELEEAIEEVTGQFPTYGTRRVSQHLRRPPHRIMANRKRIQRKMREKNQLIPLKRQKVIYA